jgi:hypothetical protein
MVAQNRRSEIAMAKNRSGHRPGGGIASKQHVSKPVRTGAPRERVIVAGVAQLGQRQGNKAMGKAERLDYSGVPIFSGQGYPSKLGNSVALNVGGGGPGTGRTIYKTGTQCMTGAPDKGDPTPKAKALWPGWEK